MFFTNPFLGLPSSKVKYLSLQNLKMTSVNEDFCIHGEHLNSIEATMLLEMVKDNPKVKELIFTGDNLSEIDEELLFQTIMNLKSISFLGTHLSLEQLTRIVSAATLSNSLESLVLSSNNLSEVCCDQLLAATAKLQVLGLESTSLTQEQYIAIVDAGNCFLYILVTLSPNLLLKIMT